MARGKNTLTIPYGFRQTRLTYRTGKAILYLSRRKPTNKGNEMNELIKIQRQIAKREKAARWFRSNIAAYGSYELACKAAQVKDENEFIAAHAANCEVFWNPTSRMWM